jgi:hypothetical protein
MGQGTWDGDYAWLEAGRRRVAEWGTGVSLDEAVRVGLDPKNSNNNGNNKANGRNQSQRQQHQNQKKTTGAKKLDGLRWAIGEIGADVDIVPEGMGRRRTNQSGWNPK